MKSLKWGFDSVLVLCYHVYKPSNKLIEQLRVIYKGDFIMNERTIQRGDIYYISNFLTCGSEQRAGRPAIIVSNNSNNSFSEVVEVVYLTRKEKPPLPTHVFIATGPCENSTALCEQITSVSVERLGDFLGRIPEELEEDLDIALRTSLALHSLPSQDSFRKLPNPDLLDSLRAENFELKHRNKSLEEELKVAKGANDSIKKNSATFKALESANSKAEMYERMYNDLLDRLVKRA